MIYHVTYTHTHDLSARTCTGVHYQFVCEMNVKYRCKIIIKHELYRVWACFAQPFTSLNIHSWRVTWVQSSEHRIKWWRAVDSRGEENIMESEIWKGRQEKQTKHSSFISVIYRRLQAHCHCDRSDQTDKMQVIKLLSIPVIRRTNKNSF